MTKTNTLSSLRLETTNMSSQLRTFTPENLKNSTPEKPFKEDPSSKQSLRLILLLTISSRRTKTRKKKLNTLFRQSRSSQSLSCWRIIILWWWRKLIKKQTCISLLKDKLKQIRRSRVLTMERMKFQSQLQPSRWDWVSRDWNRKWKRVLIN